MTNDDERDMSSKEEAFYLDFAWFISHVDSLALPPEACCSSQGNYNVAHELFYFLIRHTQLVADPLGMLSQFQKDEVYAFTQEVKSIPEEARCWTGVATISIENMRHPAWEDARQHARKLLATLAPITKMKDEYFARSAW